MYLIVANSLNFKIPRLKFPESSKIGAKNKALMGETERKGRTEQAQVQVSGNTIIFGADLRPSGKNPGPYRGRWNR